MATALKEAKCPNCGGALPKGALEGLCPSCLLDAAAETKTGQSAEHKRFTPPSVEVLGKLFPKLELTQLLGAGGMGAVYKARQPALGRFVALKILPPSGTPGDLSFAERFTREARALARLSHPNIVAVHEFGRVENFHYFIMEYVDGANLRQLERNARLSPREALQIIPQICDALQYAHDEGVVHRDIKPENVLVDRKGRVKIADFGLAKILGTDAEESRLTAEGQVMGTPHYMAPEQVERPAAVDHRADIYSLGVVFYEMLTGDLPLGKFPPPSRKVSVDVRVDEVVLRALENDPSRRYQRAAEVKTTLSTIAESPVPESGSAVVEGGARRDTGELLRTGMSALRTERHIRWAGIPVVVDRDGERAVNWEGGLAAVFIGILLIGAGLWLAKVVTGGPKVDFLGIPTVLMIFILGAGLRWALNTPLPGEAGASRRPWPFNLFSARLDLTYLSLASVLVAVFAWGVFVNAGMPAIRQQIRGAGPQIAKRESASGVFSAVLPGGGRAELLAVAFADPAPNQWWRPDGRLISDQLFEIENQGQVSGQGRAPRDLVFRLANLPPETSGPSFEVLPSGGSCSGASVLQNNARLHGGIGVRIAVPPELRAVTLRMGLGLGSWRTVAVRSTTNQSTRFQPQSRDPDWGIVFHNMSDTARGAQVTVVMRPDHPSWYRRLVAVDSESKAHSYSLGSGTGGTESSTWTYTFDSLPLERVREFRIEVQPIHWTEFKNVRLIPDLPPPPPVPIEFGPVQEVTLDEYLDFDTGKVMAEPPGGSPNFFEGVNETIAWMERTGLDTSAGNGELQPLGMIFVALENEHWSSLNATELTSRLIRGQFRPAKLKPWKNGELPSTFGFRTREGGTGLLQLLAFDEARPGATLRFKLIKRPMVPKS